MRWIRHPCQIHLGDSPHLLGSPDPHGTTTGIRHFDSVVQNALLQEKLRFATTIVVLRMKAATWNVNSLKARMPRGLEFLDQHRPALLCLQETKTEGADFPHLELQAAGHQGIEHSAGRWAGVAILAPAGSEIEEVRGGLPGEPAAEEARYLGPQSTAPGRAPRRVRH